MNGKFLKSNQDILTHFRIAVPSFQRQARGSSGHRHEEHRAGSCSEFLASQAKGVRREGPVGQAQAVGANARALEDRPQDGLTVAMGCAQVGVTGPASALWHLCQRGNPRHRGSYRVSAQQQGRKQDPRDLEVCGASAQRRQME